MANALPIWPMRKSSQKKIFISSVLLANSDWRLCFSPAIQGYHRPRHYIATQGKCHTSASCLREISRAPRKRVVWEINASLLCQHPFPTKRTDPALEERNELALARKPEVGLERL